MRKKLFLLILICFCTSGCISDTVTNRYATLGEAQADGLFARGWLPDILPASTTNIRTSNNLDLNTSTGEFFFANTEAQFLFSKLSTGVPVDAPFVSWSDTINDYAKNGFSAWSFQEENSKWAFFCNNAKNRCDYFLWTSQQAAN